MAGRKLKFDLGKEVRAIARERIGPVPGSKPIPLKTRKKPKHKKPPGEEEEQG